MGALLEQILAPATLDAAWRRLRSDHAVWAPGISRAQMEKHFVEHLLRLRDEVRTGRYRPAPLRQFPVLKANGGVRVLSALTLRDKLLQRATLSVLEPRVEAMLHADSFAYRPGRNVEQARARLRAHSLRFSLAGRCRHPQFFRRHPPCALASSAQADHR